MRTAQAADAGDSNSSIWPLTIWDDVEAAAREVGTGTDKLESLILRYERPLTIHLKHCFPWLGNEAKRLVIEFLGDRFLKEGWLAKPTPDRGRFRHFLKTSLVNYVRDGFRRKKWVFVPPEEIEELPELPKDSDAFNLEFTKGLLGDVLAQMEAYCRKPGKRQAQNICIWEIFRLQLLDPLLTGCDEPPYSELVNRLKLRSPSEGYNMLTTAKRMFRTFLHAHVAGYEGQADADLELEELREFLARMARKKDEKRKKNGKDASDCKDGQEPPV